MTDTTKPKRRKRPDDDAKLARALVFALECLDDLYDRIEIETDIESVRHQRQQIAASIASVTSVNAGRALPEGD